MTDELAQRLAPALRPWLIIPFTMPFVPNDNLTSPFTANGNPYAAAVWRDCTPRIAALTVLVATTNNASNYWTITLSTVYGGGANTNQGAVNTSALTAGQWLPLSLTTFTTATWTAAAISLAYLTITKTGAPGSLFLVPSLYAV